MKTFIGLVVCLIGVMFIIVANLHFIQYAKGADNLSAIIFYFIAGMFLVIAGFCMKSKQIN